MQYTTKIALTSCPIVAFKVNEPCIIERYAKLNSLQDKWCWKFSKKNFRSIFFNKILDVYPIKVMGFFLNNTKIIKKKYRSFTIH